MTEKATFLKGKYFDWDLAAQLINEFQPERVSAGLDEDWNSTSGLIYAGGKIITDWHHGEEPYVSSTWATPVVRLDGLVRECYQVGNIMDEPEPWPQCAIDWLGQPA